MMRIVAACLLSIIGSAQAANITIDFEQFSGVVVDLQPVGTGIALNDGFVMSASGTIWLTEANGPSPRSIDIVLNSPGGTGDVTFSKADGSAFSLLSFDYAFAGPGNWPMTLSAVKAGGEVVSLDPGLIALDNSYATYTASSLFTDIVSLNFLGDGDGPPMALDNINVSTVPVPAAVWLFGSALAGLGWLRRKQTV